MTAEIDLASELERPNAIETVAQGLLDITSARKFLGGISRAHLYNLMEKGLPFCKIGRRRMIPRSSLVRYAAERLRGGVIK